MHNLRSIGIAKNVKKLSGTGLLTSVSVSRVSSLRLAYKDLEVQRKKDEDHRMKNLQGKKKEQAERLGMGMTSRR